MHRFKKHLEKRLANIENSTKMILYTGVGATRHTNCKFVFFFCNDCYHQEDKSNLFFFFALQIKALFEAQIKIKTT